MEVVIAGDIIGSKKNIPDDYLSVIEPILKHYCKEGMYQIYRGDSFQGWINTPELALYASLQIKAALKVKETLDVRIAIGLGHINLIEQNIALSTGSALTRSGELLDSLKEKDQNLMVNSGNPLDFYMNTALKMALLSLNHWTANGAAVINLIMSRPNITQEELGQQLGIKQATASRRLDRAHWKETQELLHLFHQYYKDVHDATTH
ncbi:MAG: helix-turn-helix domain-containing protein [Nonlabens ulvanivorans]|uniref:SatD protein n=1 Tax=Nonlabens ulvanivorans TaxID=906888 RepID=A0A081DGA9_NONUL|nr:helix-turn-helix domain-containing protein [Nonlabens ulvanivorans]GAK77955.1 hypothetical protein JCM19296_3564 [Nonlabens ulvanivorans]GAL01955.1 hypothetical protein JCM19314_592 [Nonlabens ulvanivorans]